MTFSRDHERICAIEWLVRRLAVEHCLKGTDPIVAAQQVVNDAQAFGEQLYASVSNGEQADEPATSIGIASAVSALVDRLVVDVEAARDLRDSNLSQD
nr:hypothetical protein [uncultured Shinella sp.]